MKSIKIYLFCLLGLFFLASCEKEIVFNGQITEPIVVVNSYISPDSTVAVHVSESRFFLNDTTTFNNISNADVSVLVNGVLIEKMRYADNGIYTGTHKCIVGETIKLSVKVPTKNVVTCEDKILTRAEFLSFDTASTLISSYYNTSPDYNNPTMYDTLYRNEQRSYKCKLKLKDNGNEKNYYRVSIVENYNYNGQFISQNVELSDNVDPISYSTDPTNVGTDNNPYNIFTDEIFNGKEVTIKCNFNNYYDIYNPKYSFNGGTTNFKILVTLQQISKDYYLYLKTRANSGGLSFFSEPVQIHNNIQGGLGIFGSYSNNVKIISLQH